MKLFHGMVSGLAAGVIGVVVSCHSASAQLVLREQISASSDQSASFG
jgi:hypothetical protein